MRKGTVNYRLVGWMCAGSVPMAFLGAYLLHLLGKSSGTHVEQALGAALLTGAAAMVIRYVMDLRGGKDRAAASSSGPSTLSPGRMPSARASRE